MTGHPSTGAPAARWLVPAAENVVAGPFAGALPGHPQHPLKAKHLGKALTHLAEEGAAQVFRTRLGGDWIVGVAGSLQFDVLADRIRTEYDLPIAFQPTTLFTARWLEADDDRELKRFLDSQEAAVADDVHGLPVFLAANAYRLKVAQEDWPKIRFLKTREQVV